MYPLLKAACLAAYLLAVLSLAGMLPPGWFSNVQIVAAVLLTLHLVEMLVFMPRIRRYRGPLALSLLLTLLFGFLHWKPLPERPTPH